MYIYKRFNLTYKSSHLYIHYCNEILRWLQKEVCSVFRYRVIYISLKSKHFVFFFFLLAL